MLSWAEQRCTRPRTLCRRATHTQSKSKRILRKAIIERVLYYRFCWTGKKSNFAPKFVACAKSWRKCHVTKLWIMCTENGWAKKPTKEFQITILNVNKMENSKLQIKYRITIIRTLRPQWRDLKSSKYTITEINCDDCSRIQFRGCASVRQN